MGNAVMNKYSLLHDDTSWEGERKALTRLTDILTGPKSHFKTEILIRKGYREATKDDRCIKWDSKHECVSLMLMYSSR